MSADLFIAYRRAAGHVGEAGWSKLSPDERQELIEAEFRALVIEENDQLQALARMDDSMLAAYLYQQAFKR